MDVLAGSTDVTTYFSMRLTATGLEATALTIADMDLQYVRSGVAPVAKVDAVALAATDTAHTDNRGIEIDATDQPGLYRIDWPDAAFATGVREVVLSVKVATAFTEHLRVNLAPVPADVRMWLGTAPSTPTIAGVPNVNVKTWNDLTTVALPLIPATPGRTLVVDAAGLADANAVKVGPTGAGTAQTARDIGASVLLSSGTGTGQLKLASGYVAMTWADIAAPTTAVALTNTTISSTQTVTSVSGAVGSVTGNVGGNVIGSVASVTGNVGGSVLGSVTGAVGSVTAVVSANVTQFGGTNGTFAAGRPEVNATHVRGTAINAGAVAGYFPADALRLLGSEENLAGLSVVGTDYGSGTLIVNITGNLNGSIGSVATGGIAAASFAAGAINAAAIAADAITAAKIAADAIGTTEMSAALIAAIQSGLSTLTAAGVRTAVGLASANLDTQFAALAGFIDTEVASILAAVDTEVVAIKAKTDNLPTAPAAVGDIPTVSQIWTTALVEAYRAVGVAGTPSQLLHEIIAHLGDSGIVGVTKTINNRAGTAAKTYTLDSATTPTSISEAS